MTSPKPAYIQDYMSYTEFMHLLLSGEVPFNFDMTIEDWDRDFHDPEFIAAFKCKTDPCEWSQEIKDAWMEQRAGWMRKVYGKDCKEDEPEETV